MLGLKLLTDPRWVLLAEQDLQEILTDHAWCEQKAATNAISLIVHFSMYPEIVDAMTTLCREEMEHFSRVHAIIRKKGFVLGSERKDDYVGRLMGFVRNGYSPEIRLLDKLLVSAMIEARSCERFKTLSESISDQELAQFYHELMISEAGHYTLFLRLARTYCPSQDVDSRWKEFINFEGELITSYGKIGRIHG